MSDFLQMTTRSFSTFGFIDLLDIVIVAFAIYKILMFTQDTRARSVLLGLAMLLLASWGTGLLGLNTSNWLLNQVMYSGAIFLVVLFQPELRSTLEKLGRSAVVGGASTMASDQSWVVGEMVEALLRMSRRRVGALIVIEGRTRLGDVASSGTRLDALISAGLIENIFEPNTPLHDGAVIVRQERILAAGCILNTSNDDQISRDLGTRHRAALGISEDTDSHTIVVSEETGIISMAYRGKLQRHLDENGLRELLSALYSQPKETLVARMRRRTRNEK